MAETRETAMSRTEYMGLVAVAIVVLSAAGALAAEPPKMDAAAQERAARAEQMLAQTREELTRLERDVARAREVSPEPPRRMLAQLERARGRAHAAEVAARGLHWRVARPILAEVKRVIGEADRLETLLQTPPPRPPMPVGMAPAGTGSISGTVTDAATGLPLAGVQVKLGMTVYPYSVLQSTTNESGAFQFTELGASTYNLWTSMTTGYLDELFDGAQCFDGQCSSLYTSGAPLYLADGEVLGGLSIALDPAASISGVVVGEGGEPVAEAGIWVNDLYGFWSRTSTTTVTGEFVAREMAAGTYFLTAFHPTYVDELYDGYECQPTCYPEAGTPVNLVAGQALTGIVFTLTQAGTISGEVVDAGTGEALRDEVVTFYDAMFNFRHSARTDASGFYEVRDVAPGTYYALVDVDNFYDDHVSEVYDNIHCAPACNIEAGAPIPVNAGDDTGGIDFALERWGRIGGRVAAAESGLPLQAQVEVFGDEGDYRLTKHSSPAGDWVAGGLLDGVYFAIADAEDRLAELWDDHPCEPECDPVHGTPIPATLGVLTGGVDFSLGLGGWIAGTVKNRATGQPIEGVRVAVNDSTGMEVGHAHSGALGLFAVRGLPTGIYTAVASKNAGRAEEDSWDCQRYLDVPCEEQGTTIAVTAGSEKGGIDFSLDRLSSIAGSVRDAVTGENVTCYVRLYDAAAQLVKESGALFGHFEFTAVAPGTYFLTTALAAAHRDELYDNVPCEGGCDVTAGTSVSVGLAERIEGIDFVLDRLGSIGGFVIEAGSGQAIPYVSVSAFDGEGQLVGSATTNEDGAYTLSRLEPGTYFVKASNSTHRDELYDDIPCEESCLVTTGTPVSVAVNQTTDGINFTLERRAAITGQLFEEATGLPLGSYKVLVLFNSSGVQVKSTETDETGTYGFSGLAAGTYFVKTLLGDAFLDEVYDDVPCDPTCDVTSGTAVVVQEGQTATGVNFVLARTPSGTITGRVLDTAGFGIAGVMIEVLRSDGMRAGAAVSDSTGHYETDDLPTGSYFVRTWSQAYLDELFDDIPCEGSCEYSEGTPVNVVAGPTVGIDFTLALLGSISGCLTDAVSGRPVTEGHVAAYDATATARAHGYPAGDGCFVMQGLQAGSYFLTVSSVYYAGELFDDIPCDPTCSVTSGTPVVVAMGEDTAGIDFALMPKGGIAGRVTDRASGIGLTSAVVRLLSHTGELLETRWTGAGYFTFLWRSDGTYFLTADAEGYIGQLYAGRECEPWCDVTAGTPVVVTNGVITNDINFSLRKPYFADVPVEYWSRRYIESLYAAGVTAGCSVDPPLYCPAVTVSREQAAPLLLRSDEGSGYVPPPAVGVFDDVPVESGFAPWIEELALREITAGCSVDPPLYCPEEAVTRAQMAVFVLRTVEGAGYVPPPAVGMFEDVPVEDPFAPWIEEIARRGITAGCSAVPPLYCPGTVVARDQIAVFLVKAFNLPPAL